MSQTGPAAALAALLSGAEAPASQPVAGIATENPGAAGFEVGGRVFYREEALKDDSDWTYEHRLRSARMSVDYWRGEWLGVQVEVEVSGKPRATDAYVRLEEGRLSLRAGQFKTPSSVIELESAWVLPTTERGWDRRR